jgi:hypothetical protein
MPCLVCSYYIEELNTKHNRYFYHCNSTHGKMCSKWSYRHNKDPSILNLINEKLIDKIQRSIQKLCLKSLRDSPKKVMTAILWPLQWKPINLMKDDLAKLFVNRDRRVGSGSEEVGPNDLYFKLTYASSRYKSIGIYKYLRGNLPRC